MENAIFVSSVSKSDIFSTFSASVRSPSGPRGSVRKVLCLCVGERAHRIVLNIKVYAQWQAVNVFFKGSDYWKSPLRFIAFAFWVRVQVPWLACVGLACFLLPGGLYGQVTLKTFFESQLTLLPLFGEKRQIEKSAELWPDVRKALHILSKYSPLGEEKENVRMQAANCLPSLSHAWSQEFCGIPQWKFFYGPHDRWSPSVL